MTHELPQRKDDGEARLIEPVAGEDASAQHGTVIGTSLNTLTNVIGGGILSLSFAFYNGSIIPTLVLLSIMAVLAAFAAYALFVGAEATKKFTMNEQLAHALFPEMTVQAYRARVLRSKSVQAATEESAFVTPEDEGYLAHERSSATARLVVDYIVQTIIVLFTYGTLVVYAKVISEVIPPVIRDFLHGSGVWVNPVFWLACGGVVFFILSCARQMNELRWSSLVGFLTIFYIVILIIITRFRDMVTPLSKDPATRDVMWFNIRMSIFLTITSATFAFGYHFNAPIFYRELKDRTPKKMMQTVAIAFPTITFSYIATGLAGYLTFGSLVASSESGGNIVNNFSQDDIAMNIGRLGLFAHFACVFPLMAVAARKTLHRMIVGIYRRVTLPNEMLLSPTDAHLHIDDTKTPRQWIVLEAFCLVSTAVVLAGIAPGIGFVINLAGALFGVVVMFVIPGLIGFSVWRKDGFFGQDQSVLGENQLQHAPHQGFAVLSMIMTVIGVFSTILGVITVLDKNLGG